MRSKIAETHSFTWLWGVLLFVGVGCQPKSQPIETQTQVSEPVKSPDPEPVSRVQGTTDREVIAFVESLIELKSIEEAYALVHPNCLPALQGEIQKKDCNLRLQAGIRNAAEDIFAVSTYDTSKTFWKTGEFETAVEPQIVVTTKPDWAKAYFPFQDGFTKWLLAKDGNQWRIVMPAMTELKIEKDRRVAEGTAREFKMTNQEQAQSGAEIAKSLSDELKAELKTLIDENNKVGAIKRLRDELGCGLLVAKGIIESLNAEWAAAKEPPSPN